MYGLAKPAPRVIYSRVAKQKMAGMIFGHVPSFQDVVESVIDLERRLNESGRDPALASTP